MNVCLFTENHRKGGLDTFLINFVNAWPYHRDCISLICNDSHPGLSNINNEVNRPLTIDTYSYVDIGNLVSRGQTSSKIFIFFLNAAQIVFKALQYPIFFPWYVARLTLFFARSDYDRLMVVNGGYPASLLCRSAVIAWRLARKRPLSVMNFHNSASKSSWFYAPIEYFIDWLVVRSTSQIISVSKNCIDSLSVRPAFRHAENLSFIYNGIQDPAAGSQGFSNGSSIRGPDQPYCLMLATYEARKGHGYLLQAFQEVVAENTDVRLKIYGHGLDGEKEKVASEVRRLGLDGRVTLGGFTEKTAALYAGASVLVVPSQAYESFGLTIVEAMAFGVPVVMTNVGGMPEVLGDSEAGYVCSSNDPSEFADAIKKILFDVTLASAMGRKGRIEFEKRFMAGIMARQYANILGDSG